MAYCLPPLYDLRLLDLPGELLFLLFLSIDEICETNQSICYKDFQIKLVNQICAEEESMTTTVEKDKGAKGFSLKKIPYNIREIRQFPVLPPFPCGLKQAATLLGQWIKDNTSYCMGIWERQGNMASYYKMRIE